MFQRRPSGPVTVRSGARRIPRARPVRAALVAVVTGAALVATAAPALAVPPPPPNPTDGQLDAAKSQQAAVAAEVGRIAGLVAAAEAELERVGFQAEAAGAAYLAAEGALLAAQAEADEAAAQLELAGQAVAAAQVRIASFSRDSYMNGTSMSTSAALLDARGPAELIQRAAMLDYVGAQKVDVLAEMEVARVAQANAESTARSARDEMAAAEELAASAKAQADSQLAVQQGAYAEIEAQKVAYEQQLQAAQIQLLELQGARDAYQQWVTRKRNEEEAVVAANARSAAAAAAAAAAARAGRGSGGGGAGTSGPSGFVRPFSGQITSCFGSRWGATHNGLDVASAVGTPLYAPISGTVQRAGAATGFGLAVYLLGDDGAVYVYGHINDYFVRAGDRVVAGEQIAEVGNTGLSTGPHVHFEVHPNGEMYSGAVNPVPWLAARGIDLGTRCR